MKKLLLILTILCVPHLTYAVELDAVSPPAKNMTEGGMFSDPEEIPALSGDISALKGEKKVFIPYFKVTFHKEVHETGEGEASSLTAISRAKVKVNVEVKGFKEEVFQKITDLAYGDLMARLAQKGIEMIPSSEAKAKSESLAEQVQDAAKEFPSIDDEASVYVAANTTYPSGWMAGLLPDGSLSHDGDLSSMKNELDAAAVSVGYQVNYVNVVDKSEDGGTGAKAELTLAPVTNVTGYFQAFTEDGMSRLDMGQVAYSDIAFGHLENATSAGTKAALAGVAALGFLMGSGDSLDIEDYTLTVDEAKFVEATLDALKKANENFVNKL